MGRPDQGDRWMYPTGRAGIALTSGRGVLEPPPARLPAADDREHGCPRRHDAVHHQPRPHAGGSGARIAAVVRKSVAGKYRLGVRIGRNGRVWLTMAKSRSGGASRSMGRPVPIKGWRYRAGDDIRVRVQAIKQDPAQLRMKAWLADSMQPTRWQLVRNDTRNDVGSGGRVGLRSVLTEGATNAPIRVRFDVLKVNRAQDTTRVPTTRPPGHDEGVDDPSPVIAGPNSRVSRCPTRSTRPAPRRLGPAAVVHRQRAQRLDHRLQGRRHVSARPGPPGGRQEQPHARGQRGQAEPHRFGLHRVRHHRRAPERDTTIRNFTIVGKYADTSRLAENQSGHRGLRQHRHAHRERATSVASGATASTWTTTTPGSGPMASSSVTRPAGITGRMGVSSSRHRTSASCGTSSTSSASSSPSPNLREPTGCRRRRHPRQHGRQLRPDRHVRGRLLLGLRRARRAGARSCAT